MILPLSPQTHVHSKINVPMQHSVSQHTMITRLKSGAIEKKNYAAFLARFPELLSLEIDDYGLFFGGFSYVIETTDAKEPYSFRKAAGMS